MIKATMVLVALDSHGESTGARVDTTLRHIAELCGGYTEQRCEGAYMMKDGYLEHDSGTLVTVYMEENKFQEFLKIAKAFKEAAGQEAVYVEVDRVIEVIDV